ncbi:MAG TPA: hypothetical protein VFT84_00790 [Gemmatimonadales bacterium]|nr:hypothetical protein [Gemmatimonadales bacterium]
MRSLTLPLVAMLGLPHVVMAQRLSQPIFPTVDLAAAAAEPYRPLVARTPSDAGLEDDDADAATLVFAGLLGGIGGLYAGALLGASLGGDDCEECGLEEAFYGAAAGGALGISGGVHLANRGRGSFGTSALATLAIAGGGILAARATEEAAFLLAVPIGQIAAAVAIERRMQVE